MKSYYSIVIILTTLLSFSFSQYFFKENINMKGVKTETISEYNIVQRFGENVDSLELKWIYKYDKEGNNIENSLFSPSNEYQIVSNKLIRKRRSEEDDLSKFIYKYDSNNNKIEYSNYDSDGSLLSKRIYKYDSNNNKIEESNYNSEGELTDGRFLLGELSKIIYKYDSNNNVTEQKELKSEKKFGQINEILIKKSVYEYEYY